MVSVIKVEEYAEGASAKTENTSTSKGESEALIAGYCEYAGRRSFDSAESSEAR